MSERHYIALSIKHSIYEKRNFLEYWLWGIERTRDEEKRCFAGYTKSLERCELYAPEEFDEHYGKGFAPIVHPSFDMVKKYQKYDTVLIDIDEYREFLKYV